MRKTFAVVFGLAILSASICAVSVSGASAQGAVARVNGEPITSREVDQRMLVSRLVFQKPLSRDAAIRELIDDKVKLNEGRRLGMRVTSAFLDETMSRMAGNNRQSPAQFEQNLGRAGIDAESVKAKVSAEAVWGELLRARSRNSNVSNAELNAEVERRAAKGDARVTDYVVRQIVFVVPQASNPGQRERDANAVRGRFTDCDTGVEFMRTLRDVAVRERISRSSSEISKALNDTLQKTPIGRLSPPYRSEQGIEMLAVCEKKDREDRIALRGTIEQEMQQKRTQGGSDAYLNELRSKVEIKR
ncbi:MAG: SurA N-terminal domain-containing protein [Beijerinckiaceae bacterium]